MNQVINFLNVFYAIHINVKSILFQLLIVLSITGLGNVIIKIQYKKVEMLFKSKEYTLCRKKIDFLYKFYFYKTNKEYLELFKAQLLIVEDKFSEAKQILETITKEKFLANKYFWISYACLRLDDTLIAKKNLDKYNSIVKIQDDNFKYLNNLILKKTGVVEQMDEVFLQKINSKLLKDYYQQELEKQKEDTK